MHINHSSLINKDILNYFKEGKDAGVIFLKCVMCNCGLEKENRYF